MAMQKLDISGIKSKKILAIGAHPDDLEFAVGGTLLGLGEKNTIIVVCVTSGQMGSHDEDEYKQDLLSTREKEQREASAEYHASRILFFQFPDMFVTEQFKRLRKRLIKLFVKTRPDIVITHDPWTEYFPYHPDHRAIGFAVFDAVIASTLPRYLKKRSVAGKPLDPKPQLWLMHPHEASHAVDISSVYKKKLALIKTHKSQFDGGMVWKDVKTFLDEHFRRIGKEIGAEYAEGLHIIER